MENILRVLLLFTNFGHIWGTGTGTVTYYCDSHIKRDISCGSGYTLHIDYANYGRTDTHRSCPGGHIHNLCDSTQISKQKMREWCERKRNCSFVPSYKIFGDPCKKVTKFLTLKYRCRHDPGPPILSAVPNNTIAIFGTRVSLNCKSSGEQPTYTFYHDQKRIASGHTQAIVFSAVDMSYSGYYTCDTHYVETFNWTSNQIFIQVANAPKLTANPQGPSIPEDGTIIFNCDFHPGQLQITTFALYHQGIKISDGPRATFTLRTAKFINSGEYHCGASYKDEQIFKSNNLSIHVLEPTSFTSDVEEGAVVAGTNITMICSLSQTKPGVIFTFKYQAKAIQNSTSNEFKVSDAQFIDSGNYSCSAIYNGVRSLQSELRTYFVTERPTITTVPDEGSIGPGTRVVMSCNLKKKKPGVVYNFFHETKLLQQSKSKIYVLEHASFDISGDYLCSANYNGIRSLESEKRTILVAGCDPPKGTDEYNRRIFDSITPRKETTLWKEPASDEGLSHDEL